jgi:hypothetical protein
MPRARKQKKRFSAAKAVKAAAREQVGAPPPTRRVPALKEKGEKYKPTLDRLLSEE